MRNLGTMLGINIEKIKQDKVEQKETQEILAKKAMISSTIEKNDRADADAYEKVREKEAEMRNLITGFGAEKLDRLHEFMMQIDGTGQAKFDYDTAPVDLHADLQKLEKIQAEMNILRLETASGKKEMREEILANINE